MKRKFLIIIGALFFSSAQADFGLYCYGQVNVRNSPISSPVGIFVVDIGDGNEVYIEEFRRDKSSWYYIAKRINKTEDEYTYHRFYTFNGSSGTHYEYTVSRKANYIKRHLYSNPKRKNNGAYYWLTHKNCSQLSILDMERIADTAKKAEQKRIQQKRKREQQKIEQERVKF